MNDRRERIRSLLLLSKLSFTPFVELMNAENQAKTIELKVLELLNEDPGYFLVEINVKPTNNIKIIVDADQGADINHLSKINRALYKWVEENLFPNGDFSIEVSSPGLDEPLKLHRQYVKNIGRYIEVVLKSGIKREGKLIHVSDDEIEIEEEKGKGKKKEIIQHKISKDEIKSTKIQIKF